MEVISAYIKLTDTTIISEGQYTAIRSFSAYELEMRLVCIGAMQSGDRITALSGSGGNGLNDRPYGRNYLLCTSKYRKRCALALSFRTVGAYPSGSPV